MSDKARFVLSAVNLSAWLYVRISEKYIGHAEAVCGMMVAIVLLAYCLPRRSHEV